MDHLQLQSAFKFVAISRFGDGGQLMTTANLCLEAVGVYVQLELIFSPIAFFGYGFSKYTIFIPWQWKQFNLELY